LRHAQYHIFNKKYSKEEYEKLMSELKKKFFSDARVEVLAEFEKIRYVEPRALLNLRCADDFYGSYSVNCKNCYEVHDAANVEDGMYLYLDIDHVKDCCDCVAIKDNCEFLYDCMSCAGGYNCNHCFWVINSRDCDYCYCINSCDHCFGCTNLRHKKYHILNKPYPEEEYFKKVAEIKKELLSEGLVSENLLALALEGVESVS